MVIANLPNLVSIYNYADLLLRLDIQVDTVRPDSLWTTSNGETPPPEVELYNLQSRQTFSEPCAMNNEHNVTLPAYTKGFSVQLNMKNSHTIP